MNRAARRRAAREAHRHASPMQLAWVDGDTLLLHPAIAELVYVHRNVTAAGKRAANMERRLSYAEPDQAPGRVVLRNTYVRPLRGYSFDQAATREVVCPTCAAPLHTACRYSTGKRAIDDHKQRGEALLAYLDDRSDRTLVELWIGDPGRRYSHNCSFLVDLQRDPVEGVMGDALRWLADQDAARQDWWVERWPILDEVLRSQVQQRPG